MLNKSCKFQIKNGKFDRQIENIENLLSYYQEYNLIESNTKLIVETDILVKQLNEEPEKVVHKTLIILSGFLHDDFEIEEAVTSLMFELRHHIFDKIKLEFDIQNEKYLLQYFPNDEQFSCILNKDLKFDNYDFQPTFNPQLLVGIFY